MFKIVILWQLKHRLIYKGILSRITFVLMIVALFLLFGSYRLTENDRIQMMVVDYERSELSASFLHTDSDRIIVHEGAEEDALKALEEYQVEGVIVIPADASRKISAGETQKIFALYYLKGNQLAPFIADRMISNVFTQIYGISGKKLLTDLYQKYEVDGKAEKISNFEDTIRELMSVRSHGYYFDIRMDETISERKENLLFFSLRHKFSGLTEVGLLLTAFGINYIFLLFLGLKLLSDIDKNDRIALAGFRRGQIFLSDCLIFLFPQVVLLLLLLFPALYLKSFLIFAKLSVAFFVSAFFHAVFFRIVRKRQYYFPLGIGLYFIGVLIYFAIL